MASPFNSGAFEMEALTAGINRAPYTPGVIAELKIFAEEPSPTTKVKIEGSDGVLSLVPNTPRGAPATPHVSTKRHVIEVVCGHYPKRRRIYADEVQNVRGWGDEGTETVEAVVGRNQAEMRADLEATIEHQRMGAIKGLVVDVTGATLVDLYAEYGVLQITKSLDTATSTASLANKLIDAVRASEDELGRGTNKPKGFVAFCGPGLLDAIRAHPSFLNATAGWSAAAVQLADHRYGDVVIGGCRFVEIRNPSGGPTYVAADEGYLVPLGVPGLFKTLFGPADYIEAANRQGLPLYMKAEIGPMGKYVDLEAQTNPISVCTRPRAVVKLTA